MSSNYKRTDVELAEDLADTEYAIRQTTELVLDFEIKLGAMRAKLNKLLADKQEMVKEFIRRNGGE